jgi:hypothetical protein
MNSKKNIWRLVAALCAIAALAAPTSAFAQAAKDAYNTPGGSLQDEVAGLNQGGGGGDDNGPDQASASTLPFTGSDLALLFGAGALFVGAGVGMRRLSRQPDVA